MNTGDDIRELIPREIAKVKRTLGQLDIELGLVNTLSDEIKSELFNGLEGNNSTRVVAFMSEIKEEAAKLKLEILRLTNEKAHYSSSLNLLNEIETMIQLRKDDLDIYGQFTQYVRQRVEQKQVNQRFKTEMLRNERNFLGKLMRDDIAL